VAGNEIGHGSLLLGRSRKEGPDEPTGNEALCCDGVDRGWCDGVAEAAPGCGCLEAWAGPVAKIDGAAPKKSGCYPDGGRSADCGRCLVGSSI
jgi:hypothetical protein